MKSRFLYTIALSLLTITIFSQTTLEGYTFESGNRGFVKNVKVTLIDKVDESSKDFYTDESGKYTFEILADHSYEVILDHDLFVQTNIEFGPKDITEGETLFLSHELKREPGYIFEITLAEKNQAPDTPKDQMKGALVEVYNNTKEEVTLVIDSLTVPDFRVDLKKGNHYTILARHPDFLTKRMEAFVDVEGCILCFEGIGDVRPGVSDNLTENNNQGTLLANVELEKYYDGKIISLSNIYYDYNDFNITTKAAAELDKAAIFINDNPNIKIELSSHTDSRGQSDYNQNLSQQRSEAAVRYLLNKGKVSPNQMTAQGYGEEKLINECHDGAMCSEDEHKVNRRTELKLLKINPVGGYKSLESMKREEKFERMLAEMEFGGGQVKITSKDDLPPGVSGSLKSEEVSGSSSEDLETNTESTSEMKTEKTVSIQSEPFTNSEIVEMESKTMESNKETGVDKQIRNDVNGLKDYSGYKLVIHFSRFPLPDSHKIFDEEEEILDFITKDNNHLYMIGDFESRKAARSFLSSSLKKRYPNAYLVGFKDGIRVE